MRQILFAISLIVGLLVGMLPGQPVMAAPAPPFAVALVPRLNVRSAPDLNASVVGTVMEQERVTLLGRNGEGTWLRIEAASGISGWVFAELTQPSVPLASLAVIGATSASPAPAAVSQPAAVQSEAVQSEAAPSSEDLLRQTVAAAVQARAAEVSAQNGNMPTAYQTSALTAPFASANAAPLPGGVAAQTNVVALEPLCLPNKLRTVYLGGRPQVVTASGDRIYVALANMNSLMVVDTGMDMMLGTSRTTARQVVGVTATPDRLYVVDGEGQRLIITTRQGAIVGEIDLPARPGPVAVTDGRAFVLHPSMGAVSVVDTNTKETVATLSIGADPRQVAVIGGRAFVVHAAGFISVVDGYGNRHEQLHLPVNDVVSVVSDPNGSTLYIASAADRKILAVDVSSWTLANTWTLEVMPSSLALNPVTGHLFVMDTSSQFLTVLSTLSPNRVGRLQVSTRPAQDSGDSLVMLQGKLYISHPAQDSLDVWLDRTCPSEMMATSSGNVVTASYSRTDLAPRRVEAHIGILWPHGGIAPDQASFANLTATLVREDGASPACGWEPEVTLWAAIGAAPAQPITTGTRRMMTENGITFPVYDFNDVDIRATRDDKLPIHFSVRVSGVEVAQNIWTHAATGSYVPTVRPELEGLVTRQDAELDARIWVEQASGGPVVYAMLLRPDSLLGVNQSAGSPIPQLRWALNNGVTEPELIVGKAETRQEDGLTFTVWRFPGLNPDSFLQDAAQVRFWVETPDVQVNSSVLAWGRDIRTLGARLPVPVVGCR
jgi:DNA-binding beta-propeller fold protein YncE